MSPTVLQAAINIVKLQLSWKARNRYNAKAIYHRFFRILPQHKADLSCRLLGLDNDKYDNYLIAQSETVMERLKVSATLSAPWKFLNNRYGVWRTQIIKINCSNDYLDRHLSIGKRLISRSYVLDVAAGLSVAFNPMEKLCPGKSVVVCVLGGGSYISIKILNVNGLNDNLLAFC